MLVTLTLAVLTLTAAPALAALAFFAPSRPRCACRCLAVLSLLAAGTVSGTWAIEYLTCDGFSRPAYLALAAGFLALAVLTFAGAGLPDVWTRWARTRGDGHVVYHLARIACILARRTARASSCGWRAVTDRGAWEVIGVHALFFAFALLMLAAGFFAWEVGIVCYQNPAEAMAIMSVVVIALIAWRIEDVAKIIPSKVEAYMVPAPKIGTAPALKSASPAPQNRAKESPAPLPALAHRPPQASPAFPPTVFAVPFPVIDRSPAALARHGCLSLADRKADEEAKKARQRARQRRRDRKAVAI